MRAQKGFTLVELVVVIVILGLLAATALPRFVNLTGDARFASVEGMAGGLRSAVAVTQAKYFSLGISATSVTMADGTSVGVGSSGAAAGVPTATAGGIIAAMRCENSTTCQGFTVDLAASPTTWTPSGGSASCRATYDASTGAVAVSGSATACQ